MSLVEDLLVILTSYPGGYRLMRQKLLMPTYPQSFYYKKHKKSKTQAIKEPEKIKKETLRRTLYRLKEEGLVKSENNVWKITNKGKEYFKNKLLRKFPHFKHLRSAAAQKEMVVIFDIPESRKRSRDWLRGELVGLGFIQIQKSVWLGPAPLPREFINYLSEAGILQHLKFFFAKEKNIV